MLTYTEGAEYTEPDLKAGLIAAVQAKPDSYWEILDSLPANSLDGFAVHWKAWHEAATAIESDNPPPVAGELDGAPPSMDPLADARTLGELYQRREMARLHQEGLQLLREGETPQDRKLNRELYLE